MAIKDPPDAAAPATASLRRKAMVRSWICPGAGFALLGLAGIASLTFAVTAALLPASAWLVFEPHSRSAWTWLGVFGVAASLSVTEQFVTKRASARLSGPSFLVGGFPFAAVVIWVAVIGTLALLLTGFGSLQMAGGGMSPTLLKGERLLYAKGAGAGRIGRGAVVIYRLSKESAWGQPGWLTVGRILALPGDRLAIRDRSYAVNGELGPQVAVTEPYAPVIQVPPEPEAIKVPSGCYFVVQDDPPNGYDSRVLSWVEENAIVGDRLFYLSGRGLVKRVE